MRLLNSIIQAIGVFGALSGFCVQRSAAQDTTSIFKLSIEELLNLPVKVSTALKSVTTFDEAPAPLFVITREDMERMGLITLGDALNYVPGFTVGKSLQAGQQKNIYVRGEFSSFSEGILFLYNGQRLNDGITGGATAFMPDYVLDNIKQIEIVRGPVSALYGANAFVAVVNLISYRADEPIPSAVIVRGGNRGSLFVQGLHRLPLSKSGGVSFYGSAYKLDDPIHQRNIHQAVFDSVSGTYLPRNFLGRHNLEKTDLFNVGASVAWKKTEIETNFNQSLSWNHWGSGTIIRSDSLRNRFVNRNFRIGGKYVTGLFDNYRVTTLGSYATHQAENVYKVENFRSVLFPGFNPPGDASILESDLNTSTFNFETFVEWSLSAHQTVIGINLQADVISKIDHSTSVLDRNGDGIFDAVADDDTLDTVFKKETREIYAGFLQHRWQILKNFGVTGGIRWDHYRQFGNSVNPRLAIVWRPVNSVIVKGMYGKAFRAPSFFETNQSDFTSIGSNRLTENPDLKPESIETLEMQITYNPNNRTAVTLNIFQNDVHKVIRQVAVNQGVPTQTRWENAGSRDWRGVEFGFKILIGSSWSFFSNYSYTQTTDEKVDDVDDPVAGLPKHALNCALNGSLKKININVNANSRFGWNDVPLAATDYVLLERIDLVSYTILNVRMVYKNIWKKLSLSVDAYNILNHSSYYSDDQLFMPQGIAGNNRRFAFGIGYNF